MAGKFGVKGGNYRAQNDQGGAITITTDASGNGSGSAKFRQVMKKAPETVTVSPVGTTASSIGTTGFFGVYDITKQGCKIIVKGSSITTGKIKVAYHAKDDTYY